jgi:uncharacterized membrane protein YgdD (TMEM256/DUF423 family)
MKSAVWVSWGALSCGLAVITGAFGAHGLEKLIDAQGLQWWKTAVEYHFVHALGLLACGLWAERRPLSSWIPLLMVVGLVIFSGSLYAMALGAPRWLGAITPLGGTAWIAAWLGWAWLARRARAAGD